MTVSNSLSGSNLYANRSTVTFTCEVTIHDNVDTPVILNLTWTRVFHNGGAAVIDVPINGTTRIVETDLLLNDLTSQDKGVQCSGVVSSASSFILESMNMNNNDIVVAGKCLHACVHVCMYVTYSYSIQVCTWCSMRVCWR